MADPNQFRLARARADLITRYGTTCGEEQRVYSDRGTVANCRATMHVVPLIGCIVKTYVNFCCTVKFNFSTCA